jgi:hypothetical protein
MAWNPRQEPDPVRRLAHDLDAEQKEVASQLAHLREELERIKNPPPAAPREAVWHAPAKTDPERRPAPGPRNTQRVHSAQRRRDRARFILLAALFLIVVIWLVRVL